MAPLQPEVAAAGYELTTHHTRLVLPAQGRELDLTQLSLAEVEELMAQPGGFEWLRRVEPTEPVPPEKAPPAARRRGKRDPEATGGESRE